MFIIIITNRNTTEQDENSYFTTRVTSIKTARDNDQNPYPHKFFQTPTLQKVIDKYNNIEIGAMCRDMTESITSRVVLKRESSKKLRFYTLSQDGLSLQVTADLGNYKFPDSINGIQIYKKFV